MPQRKEGACLIFFFSFPAGTGLSALPHRRKIDKSP